MILFQADFSWGSSDPESSILYATDMDEAKTILKNTISKKLVFIEEEPNQDHECWLRPVPKEKGVVYTGYYCC